VGDTMRELELELKLLTIMKLLHKNKIRLIENKPVLYTSIADIHSRVELLYDTIKNNKFKPEYHNINGELKIENKQRTGGYNE
jgi:hypothetical protein